MQQPLKELFWLPALVRRDVLTEWTEKSVINIRQALKNTSGLCFFLFGIDCLDRYRYISSEVVHEFTDMHTHQIQ